MNPVERFVNGVLDHSRVIIVAMILLTVVVSAGAPMVEQTSSLDQFQTESPESEKLDYIEANFSTGSANVTRAQIILRDDNVLDRESLLGSLTYQQTLRANATVHESLTSETPTVGIANVIAIAAITEEEGRDVQPLAAEFRQLNQTVTSERAAIAARNETLIQTADLLRAELNYLGENTDASPAAAFDRVRANTTVNLTESDQQTFEEATQQFRDASTRDEIEQAYKLGTRGVLEAEYDQLQARSEQLKQTVAELRSVGDQLQTEREEYENAQNATLAEQRTQIESMNASAIEETVTTVLAADSGVGNRAFGFMPTDYDTGTATADATMLVITQESTTSAQSSAAASETVTDAQLAMQTLADDADGGEYLVFGAGIISHEIDSSMADSLLIVGPLALIFVLVALAVAYRDLLDIVLGLVGIGAVLGWTFGFMGWFDIAFNQLFIAVPVLLIGLSIDYAIHIFMRHREERTDADSPRGSMRTALAGVGIALVYVTATTVIGFLSNLTSPVPPIREFGIVSAVGILAALAVFGILMPALKVELDELLEARGFNRNRRAFGTGGGRFSSVLAVGATAARRAPYLVIALALLVSVAGGYGATQVDTSFSQEDFLAEQPPDWMDNLPEPFAPGSYSAKANLQYVNDHFVREDSQAQILVEGSVTRDDVIELVDDAEVTAKQQNVTQTLSNGAPDVQTPLSVINEVASENESFNATVAAADANNDGVPDHDIERVYDALFETAPDRASSVIYRTDSGEYEALRLVISVDGGASGEAVTEQMQAVAADLDGPGLETTATGSAILNKVVQDELLDTVINSLAITLVATFIFLMAAYRLTEGSATLGGITLLPVAFSVAWILGTMYLLDIPFNVLTGMITSLTVGLGVAYSIHLSERYNQELTRTGDIWESMHRAVTGTGGALLGSAATTVGGFGVLVFAILPPLQQFGLITGMTIIYAFLASVLVLPSLLVVWTRFVGPETGETDGEDANAAASTAPATGEMTATRTVERSVVAPGDTTEVTTSVTGLSGRAVVHEQAGASVAFRDADPMPVNTMATDDELYVATDTTDVAITYEVTVPDDAADGDEITIAGAVQTRDGTRSVSGDETILVVSDPFERITAAGTVTDADLERVGAGYAAGDLTSQQIERIHDAWVRDDEET